MASIQSGRWSLTSSGSSDGDSGPSHSEDSSENEEEPGGAFASAAARQEKDIGSIFLVETGPPIYTTLVKALREAPLQANKNREAGEAEVRVVDHLLGRSTRVSTLQGDAQRLGVSRHILVNRILEIGAATHYFCRAFASSIIARVLCSVRTGQAQVVATLQCSLYDETPLLLRAALLDEHFGGGHEDVEADGVAVVEEPGLPEMQPTEPSDTQKAESAVCKVLQTEAHLYVLLREGQSLFPNDHFPFQKTRCPGASLTLKVLFSCCKTSRVAFGVVPTPGFNLRCLLFWYLRAWCLHRVK